MAKCILSLFLFLIPFISTAKDKCVISRHRLQSDLMLNFNSFDQTQGQGHREYADRGCYLGAAKIIDIYHIQNQGVLLPWQSRVLSFHAGQMYAFENLYDIALTRFKRSFKPTEGPNSKLSWNAYVSATIAFLKKDMVLLQKNRQVLASNPTPGNLINLRVIDAFIQCFNKPYAIAYSDVCL